MLIIKKKETGREAREKKALHGEKERGRKKSVTPCGRERLVRPLEKGDDIFCGREEECSMVNRNYK